METFGNKYLHFWQNTLRLECEPNTPKRVTRQGCTPIHGMNLTTIRTLVRAQFQGWSPAKGKEASVVRCHSIVPLDPADAGSYFWGIRLPR